MKRKIKLKKILVLGLSILIGLGIGFAIIDYMHLNSLRSVKKFRGNLDKYYYDRDVLERKIREAIDSDYTGDFDKDFNNYLISLVLDDLSEEEIDKWKRYNQYLDGEELRQIREDNEKERNNNVTFALDEDTWYLRIDDFAKDIARELVGSKISEINEKKNLIVDLRHSRGGYVKSYLELAEFFCEEGTVTLSVDGAVNEKFKSGGSVKINAPKVYVFVSEKTASMAEQMAIMLRINQKAKIMGTTTYGKYIQVSINEKDNGGGYAFISGIMKDANGKINYDGIEPDVFIDEILDLDKEGLLQYIE